MAFYVYIVTNLKTGALYIGHTDDIARRAVEHRLGVKSGWAAQHGCHTLVWYSEFPTREEARTREWQMKKWKRAWKIREIEELNPEWADLLDQL